MKVIELTLCILVIIFIIVVLYDSSATWANRKSLLFRISPVLFRYQFAVDGHVEPSVIKDLEKGIRPLEFKPDPESRDIYFKQVFFNYAGFLEKGTQKNRFTKTAQMKVLKCLIAMHGDCGELHIVVTGRLDFWLLFFCFLEIPVVLLLLYCSPHRLIIFSCFSVLNVAGFSIMVWQLYALFHDYARQIETIIRSHSAQVPVG